MAEFKFGVMRSILCPVWGAKEKTLGLAMDLKYRIEVGSSNTKWKGKQMIKVGGAE